MSTDFTNKDKIHNESFFKKYPKASSIITLSLVAAFSLGSSVLVKSLAGSPKEEINITDDSNELNYYDKNYDDAIAGYKEDSKKDEWPIDIVKEAEIYSVKGDYEKSNRLLMEAYENRNKLIDENGREKYADRDAEFGNYIVVVALYNGEYKKALEYGEVFLMDNNADKTLERSLFVVYLANGDKYRDKAKELVKNYEVDNNSSYDLALYARMNMLIGEKDKTFTYLKDAWNLNKDELKVYDVISEMAENDFDSTVKSLKNLAEKNTDENCYNLWLTKCYSLNEKYNQKSLDTLDSMESKDLGESVIYGLKAKVYGNSGDKDAANEAIENLSNKEEKTYVDYYELSEYYIDNKEYDKALENAKNCIVANKSYPDGYGYLMTEIMVKQKQVENAEPYFRTALRIEPFNSRTIMMTADYYCNKTKNTDTGYKYYDIASVINPNNSKIYYNLAKIAETNRKNDDAIKYMKKAISINDEEIKYHNYLGVLYYNANKKEDAIKEIRAAYSLDKNDIVALNNAGCYYIATGDYDRGLENIKGAYEKIQTDTDVELVSKLTTNYEKAKSYVKAVKSDSSPSKPELDLLS